MVRDAREGSGAQELAALVSAVAAFAAVVAVLLIALALVAEFLRRRRRGGRLVAVLDRVLPFAVRAAVVSIVTVVGTSTAIRPAGGADTVRGWLRGDAAGTTTTSTTSTPTSSTTSAAPPPTSPAAPTVLVPPLVLEPPVTFGDLEPPPAVPARPATPLPDPATPTTPAPVVRPAPPTTVYVVAPGDCLWSIAARLLGPGADDRSIDAGWRHIYAANRAAIGEDPNLIHVGLALQLPPLDRQP